MAGHNDNASLLLILGNQLFPPALARAAGPRRVFMAEDDPWCTSARHHKLKWVLVLASMRSYADDLRAAGFDVSDHRLDASPPRAKPLSYEQKLARHLDAHPQIHELVHFEIEDKPVERRIVSFCEARGLKRTERVSPMFVTTRRQFADYLEDTRGKPFMATFYKWQRRRLGILLEDGKPVGGRWSFDDENRKKLPKDIPIPPPTYARPTSHVRDVIAVVNRRFADHPGGISDAEDAWFPTTRRQALRWLREFLAHRFAGFGDYEDALSARGDWLFHSVLTPALNQGLLTPGEVVDRALKHAEQNATPLNAVEGFVRQVIGWREFIRGIYRHYSDQMESTNRFDHHRGLSSKWTTGRTGLPPLDDAIRKALRLGWTHHIERLMVLCNFMNLCEIEPRQAHDWFMQMFVDASDWVMGPNVYGMGLRSDGGVFSTKPYICGSNYLLKMGDYGRGDWCDVADGLYWRFVDRHRSFFNANPRTSMAVRSLDKMREDRRGRVLAVADRFIADVTTVS